MRAPNGTEAAQLTEGGVCRVLATLLRGIRRREDAVDVILLIGLPRDQQVLNEYLNNRGDRHSEDAANRPGERRPGQNSEDDGQR